jgi:DNA-binding NarL/FixJ family response regulator
MQKIMVNELYIKHGADSSYVSFVKHLHEETKQIIDQLERDKEEKKILKIDLDKKINNLSKREKEVFSHLIEGKNNAQIADALFICLGSVKFHITNIYKKLGIQGRSKLITTYWGIT